MWFHKSILFAALIALSFAQQEQIEPCSSKWVPDLFQLVCLDFLESDSLWVDGRVLVGPSRLNLSNFIVGKGLLFNDTTDDNTTRVFECPLENNNNNDTEEFEDVRDARAYPFSILATGEPIYLSQGSVFGGNVGLSSELDQAQLENVTFEGDNCQAVGSINSTIDLEIWKTYLRNFESRLANKQPNGRAQIYEGTLTLTAIDDANTNNNTNNDDTFFDRDILFFRVPVSAFAPITGFQWNIDSNRTFKGYVIDLVSDSEETQNLTIPSFPDWLNERIREALLPFSDRILYHSSTLRWVQFEGNASIFGTILAPNATITIAEEGQLNVFGNLIVNGIKGNLHVNWPEGNDSEEEQEEQNNGTNWRPWCWGNLFEDLNAGGPPSSPTSETKKRSIFSKLLRKNW